MATATVSTPTVSIGGQNFYVGQSYAYGGGAVPALYNGAGNFVGFMSPQGTLFSGPPGVQPAPTITPTGGGSGATAPAASGSYLGSGANAPQIGGQSPWRVYTNKPTTGAGAAPYDPTSYTVTSGVKPSTAMSSLGGYQVFQMGNMPVAYDSSSGTFGQLQGNTYVPYSRDEAQQLGLIQQTTDPALPEQNALGMMGQIDPTGEALRQGLGQSYLSTLNQAPMPTAPTMAQGPTFAGGQAPAAGDVQSYLNLYKQIDPEGYAQHANLATSMDQYVQQMQNQAALGTQLDPETVREITQATRQGQVARGNVYGTPQLMQEAVTRGQAGLAIQQQRQAQLASALGQQQGYLSSGMGLGDIANTLYQQGFARNLSSYQAQQQAIQNQNQQALNLYQAQLGARSGAQQGALGYLGSGQTPLGAASSYMGMAENAAGAAAQGGPQYNPASLGPTYTGAGASQFPQYGIDTSQLANQWYNSLGAYGGGMPTSGGNIGKAAGSAATGALSGAASGAALGSVVPGLGTLAGAAGGALVGGLGAGASSYFA